ncbi:pentatricopeptide repeat-containing protein At1g11900 isoform X2 [Magnolia sinica]|uniref:pentatricopeptide repeat-containing protein At1g11900 isoform X2 n=1 Tax=Magnolia sinica TaxID=86752 RepID=UPI00265A902B|nr:pentatricopeptide repeat-containing protein At1g11900 isoform X2 [Magnolia sinica]XP_058075255.1 pentatricopeptide repeat-containing protein At1g11900 isoform X2 [Magnolia sinica]
MSSLISLYRISVKCRSDFYLRSPFHFTFLRQFKTKPFKISTTRIPSKVCRLLPFVAVQIISAAAYCKCRTVVTQGSADEQEVPDETLKQILVAAEHDPFSIKRTCSIYIEKLCQSGNLSDLSDLLKGLRDKQIFLSFKTYKTILVAAAEANKFELSCWVFKDLLLTSKSQDSSSFINFAKAFQKTTDLDLLLKFIREVSELTFPRSATVINRIIVGFAESGQSEKALLIFEEMKNLKCKPDTVTWNIVLAVKGKAGRADQLLSVFSSMKESDHVPDIVTYNTLINSFRKMGRLDLCSNFAHEMVERGIGPDLRTYTALIDGFGRLGNVDEALRLFDEMRRRRVRPSIYVYRSLISNLKKVGKLELALSLSEEMNSLASKLVGPEDFRRRDR